MQINLFIEDSNDRDQYDSEDEDLDDLDHFEQKIGKEQSDIRPKNIEIYSNNRRAP